MTRELIGPIGNDTYREYVGDILQSGQLLLDHVNGILDLSRIESGKHDLYIDRLTLADAWMPIASTLGATAAAKGVEIRLLEPVDAPAFAADQKSLSQILVNLVSNSIKFTPTGGHVEIGSTVNDRGVAVFVRDTGRGIPADRLTDVLKPFVQVSDALVRDTGGVGLGLAICKSLAEAMSGRIEITSQIGQGTTVTVFLPRWQH
jgi:signal transduction histidine kinase